MFGGSPGENGPSFVQMISYAKGMYDQFEVEFFFGVGNG